VNSNDKTITILIDEKTQLRRRFWGKANLDEFQINDRVDIVGKWTDENQTSVQAVIIRNLSIQKRYGVFFGKITSIENQQIVIETVKRGSLTVVVIDSTKLVNRKMEELKLTDLAVGHYLRVKGLWNNQANTLTEVTQIKDFSLPILPKPTRGPE
jgi:hypothetical protein